VSSISTTGGPLPYDALLVATGGWANKLQVPGVERVERIFNFVTMDDTRDLIAHALQSKTAVTTGGSFIAYELTEGLNVRGVHVTWLMRGPYWLRNILDAEGGQLVDDIAARTVWMSSTASPSPRWWPRMASRSTSSRPLARPTRRI